MQNILDVINKAIDAVQGVGNAIVDKIQESHPEPKRDAKIDAVQAAINKAVDDIQKLTGHVE